jgi:hypothetical protein
MLTASEAGKARQAAGKAPHGHSIGTEEQAQTHSHVFACARAYSHAHHDEQCAPAVLYDALWDLWRTSDILVAMPQLTSR